MLPYNGKMTRVSTPASHKAPGKDPATSPRPPTLMNGTASLVTNKTFMDLPPL
jgi:hypothetical protein